MKKKHCFLSLVSVLLISCGGQSSRDDSPASGGASSDEAPSDEMILEYLPCPGGCENEAELDRPTPGPRPSCPLSEPDLEGDCGDDVEGMLCTYGDSPRVACRARYTCREGQWSLPEALFGQCVEPEEGFCPEARPQQDAECTVSSAGEAMVCGYEDNVTCSCFGRAVLSGEPGDPGRWVCNGPPANESCPAVIPNIGDGCETHAVQCKYAPSICEGATYDTVFCFNGEWELGEDAGCDA